MVVKEILLVGLTIVLQLNASNYVKLMRLTAGGVYTRVVMCNSSTSSTQDIVKTSN